MKKILLALAIGSVFAVVAPAHAKCAGPGARIGEYDTGSVTVGDVTIFAERFGELVAGPLEVCASGSVGPAATSGSLTIKNSHGDVLCHTNDIMGVDPFGFGTGVHSGGATHDADCGADISWVDLAPTFGIDAADIGVDPDGAHIGIRKHPGMLDPVTTAVPPACTPALPDPAPQDPTCTAGASTGGTTGSYWLERDSMIAIPAGTSGYLTRGIKVEIDS
jgi:hypothetical protein